MIDLIPYFSFFSTFIPFVLSTWFFKNKNFIRQQDLILLWSFWCLSAVVEVIVFVLATKKIHNIWVFQVYSLIEYLVILNLLKGWLQSERMLKWVRYAIFFYPVLFLVVKFTGIEPTDSNSYNFITRPTALVIMVFFIFKALLELWENTAADLNNDYRFWILFALVIYYSSSTGLFSFSYVKKEEILKAIVYIHAVLNIIHNLLFTIGVFKVRAAQRVALEPSSSS